MLIHIIYNVLERWAINLHSIYVDVQRQHLSPRRHAVAILVIIYWDRWEKKISACGELMYIKAVINHEIPFINRGDH